MPLIKFAVVVELNKFDDSSQHRFATCVISSPLEAAFTASASNLMNRSHTGFRMAAMKFACAIASMLSKGMTFVMAFETMKRNPVNISIGNKTAVVRKLNISFRVAPLKALLNSFGSPDSVSSIKEFVTQFPMLAPKI